MLSTTCKAVALRLRTTLYGLFKERRNIVVVVGKLTLTMYINVSRVLTRNGLWC